MRAPARRDGTPAIFSRGGERGNPVRACRNRVGRKASRDALGIQGRVHASRPAQEMDVAPPLRAPQAISYIRAANQGCAAPSASPCATARILYLTDREQPRMDSDAAQDLP